MARAKKKPANPEPPASVVEPVTSEPARLCALCGVVISTPLDGFRFLKGDQEACERCGWNLRARTCQHRWVHDARGQKPATCARCGSVREPALL